MILPKRPKKYGKLLTKRDEDIPSNKICVDLIGSCIIRRKVKKKGLHLKYITILGCITGRFKIR